MELSTYFRINQAGTGQFERTLLIADKGSYVSYLEGCTAPSRDENQLHAAVVELIAMDDAEIKYSTVQNWYPGNAEGKGGVYNFVTKRGLCEKNAKISWTQVETGSAVTWKYPSCILKGDNSVGEFYSIAVTNNYQQADTGTKMIHLGKNTKSTIISKGISAGKSQNSYRGLVKISKNAKNARNFSQCDSLLMGNDCGAHTFPYIEVKNKSAQIEHEASTSKIGEDQIFYCSELETLRTDRIPSARRAVETSHAAFRNPSPWKITATLARKQETSVTIPPSLVLSKMGIDGSPRSPTPTGRPLIGSFKTDSTTRTPRTWMIAKPRCSRFLRTWSSIRRSRATTDSSMRLWPGSTDTKRDAKPAIP